MFREFKELTTMVSTDLKQSYLSFYILFLAPFHLPPPENNSNSSSKHTALGGPYPGSNKRERSHVHDLLVGSQGSQSWLHFKINLGRCLCLCMRVCAQTPPPQILAWTGLGWSLRIIRLFLKARVKQHWAKSTLRVSRVIDVAKRPIHPQEGEKNVTVRISKRKEH